MKIKLEQMEGIELEVVIRYKELDETVLHLLSLLKTHNQKICVYDEEKNLFFLSPGNVFYVESVDEKTFLYCENKVYRLHMSLAEFFSRFEETGFLRISKSICVNLHKIRRLKSCAGGRIEALMQNEEKIMVSRHYAPLLRQTLGL